MIQNNRIIFDNNGTQTDLSVNLNKFQSGTSVVDLTLAEDYLYIGSDWPFNHRYFEVSVVNSNTSVMSVEYWDGSTWQSAVDVLDQTAVGGKTLAQSGIISWTPDPDYVWQAEDTEDIAALSSLRIYGFYWARLKVSASLSVTTALKFVGHKFSDDEQLGAQYPELESTAFKTAFESGKTNWNEQHVQAAEIVIRDLIKAKRMVSGNQVLTWEKFILPSVHQVAAMAYRAMGDDYKDNLADALSEYREAIDMVIFDLDQNKNAILNASEKISDTRVLRR